MTGRPRVWEPKQVHHLFVDFKSGRAVTWDWRRITVKPSGRRKTPALVDMLNTAHALGSPQIIVTGKLPELRTDRPYWMLAETPGWKHGQHWLSREPRIGRYKNELTGHEVEIRPASEWFNDAPVDQLQAKTAWDVLSGEVEKIVGTDHNDEEIKGGLFYTPTKTAVNLWGMLLPKRLRSLPSLPADIAEQLHSTSGQHRIEHLTTTGQGDNENDYEVRHFDAAATPKLDTFAYIDGRFMYSALGWGVGLGAHRITAEQAALNIFDREPLGDGGWVPRPAPGIPDGPRKGGKGQYVPGWYKVRAKVPKEWRHVGLLPLQAEDQREGWLYPNRPGATFETWASGAEIKIADDCGWELTPLEGIVFDSKPLDDPDARGKAKPNVLDNWAGKLNAARDAVQRRDDLDPEVRQAVAGALRAMLLQGIGNFAKRLRGQDVTVTNPLDIPAEYADTAEKFGDRWVYHVPGRPFKEHEKGYYHPELAVQVWGRARARMLQSPAPRDYSGPRPGMLSMDPSTILGVRGDAVYASEVPRWALPAADGGADDGKNGRLRIKGVLNDVPTPLDEAARNELRVKAERKGWEL